MGNEKNVSELIDYMEKDIAQSYKAVFLKPKDWKEKSGLISRVTIRNKANSQFSANRIAEKIFRRNETKENKAFTFSRLNEWTYSADRKWNMQEFQEHPTSHFFQNSSKYIMAIK